MGRVCTFFGHRDCPDTIRPKAIRILRDLIECHGVDTFYVGRQGMFDIVVRSVLRELKNIYPHISYAVILERVPSERAEYDFEDYSDTLLPDGIENVHPRYAISWRNRWMLRQSDYVVVYVAHSWGGAAKFAGQAARQGRVVINLIDIQK